MQANKIQMANIQIARANEEVPWALPKNCVWFTLQVRDGTALRIAVEAGHVANSEPPYFTLKADNAWDEKEFNVVPEHGFQLYLACSDANKMVEVMIGVFEEEAGGKE